MTRLYALLGAIGAALAGIVAFGRSQRRKGRDEAQRDATEADRKRAITIEEKADAARANNGSDDPVERLRKHGQLRD